MRLRNKEHHDMYSSPSIIRIMKLRRMRWAGHVARMDEKQNVYRLLVGKPEGRRPLGRPRSRWMDNIRMDLVEVGWGEVDWIGLDQDRDRWRALVKAVMNLLFHKMLGNIEWPPVVNPLDSFPALYGTGRFITEFARALRLSLS
jgi:hypothetical protein